MSAVRSTWPANVLERSRLGAGMAFVSFQGTNGVPQLMSLAERGNVQLLEILELQVEQDGPVNVMNVEALDDRRIGFGGVHPVDDLLR